MAVGMSTNMAGLNCPRRTYRCTGLRRHSRHTAPTRLCGLANFAGLQRESCERATTVQAGLAAYRAVFRAAFRAKRGLARVKRRSAEACLVPSRWAQLLCSSHVPPPAQHRDPPVGDSICEALQPAARFAPNSRVSRVMRGRPGLLRCNYNASSAHRGLLWDPGFGAALGAQTMSLMLACGVVGRLMPRCNSRSHMRVAQFDVRVGASRLGEVAISAIRRIDVVVCDLSALFGLFQGLGAVPRHHRARAFSGRADGRS